MSPSNNLLWFLTVIGILGAVEPFKNAHGSSDIIKRFPYLVGLAAVNDRIDINDTVCSGTLVSPDFVLTSAHCASLLQAGKIRVFSRKSATRIKTRLAVKVYIHPSYDPKWRLYDLSLVKLKKPFRHVNRFVRLSSKRFNRDQDMDCVVIGIKGTDGHSYRVRVRAKYGRSACQIPNSNSIFKYILSYTWTDFLCSRTTTVGPTSPTRLPCGRSDPLLCDHNRQYGIVSYGYGTDGGGGGGGGANAASEPVECGDPAVQGRSLYVNKHYRWIANLVSGSPEDKVTTVNETVRAHTPTPTTPTPRARTTPTPRAHTTPTPWAHTTPTPRARTTSTEGVAGPDPDRYPYLVRLRGHDDELTCGGALVSPYHVLTSAHCTTGMTDVRVTTADRRQFYASPDYTYLPRTFDAPTLTADVSIIVFRDPIYVSEYAEISDFPDPSDAGETVEKSCVVVAQMPEAPYRYQRSVRAKYGARACQKASVSEIQEYIDQTSREFICGLYENRFEEDTGSPLICDGKLYGIISHGYQIEHPNANITQQMRFLSVKNYKPWIINVIVKTTSQNAAGTRVQNHQCGLITSIIVLLFYDVFRRL